MTIGIDGHTLLSPTLSGELTFQLIESLTSEYPGDTFHIYITRRKKGTKSESLGQYHNVSFRLPAQSGFQGRLWRMFGLTNNLEADKTELFHGPAGRLPLNITSGHIPSVVTLTEKEVAVPGRGSLREGIRAYLTKRACRDATRIITPSQEIKDKICQSMGIDSSKIDVISPEASVRERASKVMGCYKKAVTDFYPSKG